MIVVDGTLCVRMTLYIPFWYVMWKVETSMTYVNARRWIFFPECNFFFVFSSISFRNIGERKKRKKFSFRIYGEFSTSSKYSAQRIRYKFIRFSTQLMIHTDLKVKTINPFTFSIHCWNFVRCALLYNGKESQLYTERE